MNTTPYRDGRLYVCSHECDTCVFKRGNLMFLMRGRLKNLIRENLASDSALTCHCTLDGDHAICRGFFDRFKDQSRPLTLAECMGVITYIDPPPKE